MVNAIVELLIILSELLDPLALVACRLLAIRVSCHSQHFGKAISDGNQLGEHTLLLLPHGIFK